jgi:drug/metabolite transporter (DMT)-like permease
MTRFSERLRCDLLLLLASLLWGSAFVPQRLTAESHFGTFLFNGLRFLLGAAVLVPWAWPRLRPSRGLVSSTLPAGVLLVAASACQQDGMKSTTAGDAGFLTGLYVVLVPVVLFVVWRQKMAGRSWAGALVAAIGVFLLGVDDKFQLGIGNSLEVLGAFLWAFHVVIVGRAVRHVDALAFSAGQYLVAGMLNLSVGLALESQTLPRLADCWQHVVYTGVFSVAAGYTLQAIGQKQAPAADAAIILSMEAVFAALFGYLILGETLVPRQMAGCALILTAVVMVQNYKSNSIRPGPP